MRPDHHPQEAELRARCARLTLPQKVSLVSGASYWTVGPEPAAGLRTLVFSDGPVGVRGQRWDERDPSANIPTTIALASSWDTGLVREIGLLLGDEAIRKQVDVLLAPVVNLVRSPLGGRTFESFGEDQLLAGELGAAFVEGVQAQGIAATAKHFVANDSETDRYVVDVTVDDLTLRELYLAPFKRLVEAGVWAVMAAYNLVRGEVMTESRLLQDVLRDEWGFDGLVMSDWMAVRSVEASAKAALDLAMPGPRTPWSEGLEAAVRDGRVSEADLDEKVIRILRLAARVGALDGVPSAVPVPERSFDVAQRRDLLDRAAADGMVLLRNAGPEPVLPLDPGRLRTVAVLGPAAGDARSLGGGSATVYPDEQISPLDALAGALGPLVELLHVPAVSLATRLPLADWASFDADPEGVGLRVEYLDGQGQVLAAEHRRTALFKWLGEFVPGLARETVTTIRVSGVFRAASGGSYGFGGSGVGGMRVEVGGRVLFDEVLDLPAGTDPIEAQIRPPQRVVDVEIDAGALVPVVLEHRVVQSRPTTKIELNVVPPRADEDAELDRAVDAARAADAAIVLVGTSAEIETESMDRRSMSLPGRQDELVRRVAAVNPRTVVVLNSGSPVLLPWIDQTAAVLAGWFGGERLGPALADVLLGRREPGGRLPVSWPHIDGAGIPSTIPVDGRLEYAEGPAIGYRSPQRRGNELFCFGHGLGYTSWDPPEVDLVELEDGWRLRVGVANTGARSGRSVIQVYARQLDGAADASECRLVGFARTPETGPAERAQVAIDVPRQRLARWSAEGWVVPEGRWVLEVGRSLDDLASVPVEVTV